MQCGWVTDLYGLTWQVVPEVLGRYLADRDPKKSGRVMDVMLKMKKLDCAALKKAYEGKK
jgi:predicted 3-demethylubiquinone-9 3-methyltransferase (glyoxalase superfamily)